MDHRLGGKQQELHSRQLSLTDLGSARYCSYISSTSQALAPNDSVSPSVVVIPKKGPILPAARRYPRPVRKFIDEGTDDHPADEDKAAMNWVVAVNDDCDGCGDLRVLVTLEERDWKGEGRSPTSGREVPPAAGRAGDRPPRVGRGTPARDRPALTGWCAQPPRRWLSAKERPSTEGRGRWTGEPGRGARRRHRRVRRWDRRDDHRIDRRQQRGCLTFWPVTVVAVAFRPIVVTAVTATDRGRT